MAPPFRTLRHQPKPPNPDAQLLREAALQMARTKWGKIVLAWMQNEVSQPLSLDSPDGALREQNGARRLLAKLEALMASDNHVGRIGEGS